MPIVRVQSPSPQPSPARGEGARGSLASVAEAALGHEGSERIPPVNKWLAFLVALSLLGALGCGRVQQEKKTRTLEASTSAYGNALRWGYPETAWNYLTPDVRVRLAPEQVALKHIRVTAYEVVQPALLLDEEQDQAEQEVRIDFVRHDTQVVRSLTDHQRWGYDEASGGWRLQSDPPTFR